MLQGDEAVVNCVQCHPSDCVVATSGIDNTIKLWTPSASVPSAVAGGAAGPETANVANILVANQRRLCAMINNNLRCYDLAMELSNSTLEALPQNYAEQDQEFCLITQQKSKDADKKK